jgi:hypothetical protein
MNKTRTIESSVCIAVLLAVLFVGVWQIKPAHAATLFSDNFEDATLNAWTDVEEANGVVSVSTDYAHHGSYSMKCAISSSVGQADAYKNMASTANIGYWSGYVRVSALPSTDDRLYFGGIGHDTYEDTVFVGLAHHYGEVFWELQIWVGGSADYIYETTASNPSANTWYGVEVVRDVTSGITRLYVAEDGENYVQKIQHADSHSGTNNLAFAGVAYTNYAPVTVYVDCVKVADAFVDAETEVDAITFSLAGTNSTLAGEDALFHVNCTANLGTLSHYCFDWKNGSSSWINGTWTEFSSTWINITKKVNETVNVVIYWVVSANDSLSNTQVLGLQQFTTTAPTYQLTVQSIGVSNVPFSINGSLTETEGNMIYAQSGYWKQIQNAVDIASTGDTVVIPEGTWNFVNVSETWTEHRIIVPAGVNIKGVATERDSNDNVVTWKTILKMPWDMPTDKSNAPNWFWFRGTSDPDKPSRFSDIELIGYRYYNSSSIQMTSGVSMGGVDDGGIINFRVDHCYFRDICGGGVGTAGSDLSNGPHETCGVIDHCKFINSNGVAYPWGDRTVDYGVYVSRGGGWNPDSQPAQSVSQTLGNYTDHTVFVEDCYFETWRHCVVCRQGGHVVVRRSTIYNDIGYGSVDIHGDSAGVALEVYDCNITMATDAWYAMMVRAGFGVAANNVVGGGAYKYFIEFVDESANSTYWVNHFYVWNNTMISGCTPITEYDPSGNITENVDYFLRAPSQEQDGWTYTPYRYPFVFTTYATNQTFNFFSANYNVTIASSVVQSGHTYTFQEWEDSSTNPIRIITLTSDTTLTANFTEESESVNVYIINPQNGTYTTSSIPVYLSASGGTIDKIWYNFKNGTSWIYPSNQTYLMQTSASAFQNGTDYTFVGWANNSLGTLGSSQVMFTVAIPAVNVVVTITSPTNTTYPSSSVSVSLSASGGTIDTIWWNCKNGSSWIYGSNQTYTAPTSMTGFVNGASYTFYAWANNTLGEWDEETVMFTVLILYPEFGSWWGDWWGIP